jgi:hypothetical protein
MSQTLQQASENLAAAEDELTRAIELYAQATRERWGDELPEVPENDAAWANLGRFGEAR